VNLIVTFSGNFLFSLTLITVLLVTRKKKNNFLFMGKNVKKDIFTNIKKFCKFGAQFEYLQFSVVNPRRHIP
jgi:hypothetical protein